MTCRRPKSCVRRKADFARQAKRDEDELDFPDRCDCGDPPHEERDCIFYWHAWPDWFTYNGWL